jgi:hypothetical protein
MNDTAANAGTARNPVLWLVIGLPLLAVAGSFTSLGLAILHGDKELPAAYHWEGQGLAGDEARIAEAGRLGLTAQVQADAVAGRCTVQLAVPAGDAIDLDLTHPTEAAADRHLVLQRDGSSGLYGAACAALPAAHWWVQVGDPAGRWLLRGRADGALAAPLLLSPRAPARDAPSGQAPAQQGPARDAGAGSP